MAGTHSETGLGRVVSGVWNFLSSVSPRKGAVVRFEQAVYGSFPFRDQGYAMLAASPGCQPEWLAEFRAACQWIGERPARVAEASGLFTRRLENELRMVVGMTPQGRDDRGRPGALAFHGLFLTHREYKKAGSSPFNLLGALRSDWTAETTSLPAGVWTIRPSSAAGRFDDPRAARIARALSDGRRVIVESPHPIDALARHVWDALPGRTRTRASVATWAFSNGNKFDLLGVPRLAGVAIDGSYDVELESGAGIGA